MVLVVIPRVGERERGRERERNKKSKLFDVVFYVLLLVSKWWKNELSLDKWLELANRNIVLNYFFPSSYHIWIEASSFICSHSFVVSSYSLLLLVKMLNHTETFYIYFMNTAWLLLYPCISFVFGWKLQSI